MCLLLFDIIWLLGYTKYIYMRASVQQKVVATGRVIADYGPLNGMLLQTVGRPRSRSQHCTLATRNARFTLKLSVEFSWKRVTTLWKIWDL